MNGPPQTEVRSARDARSNAGVLLASRLVLIVCGYATYVIVAHSFTTAQFGVYGVMAAIINVLNTVVGTGTSQAISRLVTRHRHAAASILRRGIWWSGLATLSVGLCVGLGAPLLAAMLRDASLTKLLVIAAAVPGIYAFNACYSGFLNGMGALARQGFVNMSFAVARVVLIGAAAWLGYGVEGALYASVLAAVAGAVAARWLARVPMGTEALDIGAVAFVRMMMSFIGVSLLLQLLLANDVLLVKRLMPAASADQQAGIYTAAQSIARIPYFLLIGISQIVYPRLSARATADGKRGARETSSLVLSGMIVILSGILALCLPLTTDMIRLIYPARYAEGGAVLGWLLGGSAVLSLAESSLTMLSGAGGPRAPAAILVGAVLVQLALGLVLTPLYGPLGAALATLLAALAAAVAAMVLLHRLVGTTLSVRILATAAGPLAVLAGAALLWARLAWPPIATLAFLAAGYAGYILAVYRLNSSSLKSLLQPDAA